MIPKVIHYVWFGEKKPQYVITSINTWRDKLPEYKFFEWNEKNTEKYLSNDFTLEALKEKKYAFLSDYIRLRVLHEFGGIYLDTDMVVNKNFDDFLEYETFWGRMYSNAIGSSVIGSVPQSALITKLITKYDSSMVGMEESNNRLITRLFIDEFHNFNTQNKMQIFDGKNLLLPTYYFYLPSLFNKNKRYAYHLFINSWNARQQETLKNRIISCMPYWVTSYVRNKNGTKRFMDNIDYKQNGDDL